MDLYRVLRAQKSMKELKSDATAEDVIDKAWLVNESIKAIAEEMNAGANCYRMRSLHKTRHS